MLISVKTHSTLGDLVLSPIGNFKKYVKIIGKYLEISTKIIEIDIKLSTLIVIPELNRIFKIVAQF